MTFVHFKSLYGNGVKIIQEIGAKHAIKIGINDTHLIHQWSVAGLSLPTAELIRNHANETSSILDLFLSGEVFAKGPKIFEVKQIDFEALSQIDLNIPIEEYSQPFETIVIQLPENFCQNKRIRLPQAGEIIAGDRMPDFHEPDFIILYYNHIQHVFVVSVVFTSHMAIKTSFAISSGNEIEQVLQTQGAIFNDSLVMSDDEQQLFHNLSKAALNYCLLIQDYGCKSLGPKNPKSYRQATIALEKHVKEQNTKAANHFASQLKSTPLYYTLQQEIKLFKTVTATSELPEQSSGRTMPPHHRRGHYRMQHYGKNNESQKRIRILPVFVNKHLFLGTQSETRVIYHD